jgi:hypothetical protein
MKCVAWLPGVTRDRPEVICLNTGIPVQYTALGNVHTLDTEGKN